MAAAGKQKNTPVIVMKKKRHIISPPLPELPPWTVENEITTHQAKKTENGHRNSSTPVLKRLRRSFPCCGLKKIVSVR